jgi:hypothetical protein
MLIILPGLQENLNYNFIMHDVKNLNINNLLLAIQDLG